jgi:hypothetical protein
MGAITESPIWLRPDGRWRPTRRDVVVGAIAVILFVGARLMHLGSFRMWFDEVFTFDAAARDWGGLLWYVRNYDVHPPLFYMLAKLWIDIGGDSFLWLGLFPALTAIATLLPLYLLAREVRVTPAEFNLALVLMALNGYLTGYAQEFRAYDWLMFISVSSLWLFVRYCNTPREQQTMRAIVPLALVNLAMVYTHYYGWLLVGVEGLCLLLLRPRRLAAFVAASAAAVLAYIPWAYLVVRAAAERSGTGEGALFYIPPPDAFSVAFFFGALNGLFDIPRTTSLGVVLFAVPVLVWIWRAWIQRDRDAIADRAALVLLATAAVLPVAIAFVASQLLPSAIWGQRHLILVAAPYYLLVAAAVMRLPGRTIRHVAVAVTVTWAMTSGIAAQRAPYKKPAWDELVAYITAHTPPGQRTRIYAIDEDAAFPMQFYLRRSGRTDIEAAVVQEDTPANRAKFASDATRRPYWALAVPVVLATDLRSLGDTPFWICDDREDAANLGQPGRSLPEAFSKAGYTVGTGPSVSLINRRWTTRMVSVLPVSAEARMQTRAAR